MEIEKDNNNIQESPFKKEFEKVSLLLEELNKKKESHQLQKLTSKAKQLSYEINQDKFRNILKQENTQFSNELSKANEGQNTIIPIAQTDREIILTILLSLSAFKQKNYEVTREILNDLLFEKPHLFSHKLYLNNLSDFLFYKMLNAIQFSGQFEKYKQDLYRLLKQLEISKKELLFCNLYTFLMRNLLEQNQYKEFALLIKNCYFPELIQFIHFPKYLFYRAVFNEKMGNLQESFKLIGEAIRKTPQPEENQQGLKVFILLLKKHFIILQLLLNETPQTQMFQNKQNLFKYKRIVQMVQNGHKQQFEDFIQKEKKQFQKDLVFPLLEKLKSIVIRNAIKNVSKAYTKISHADVYQKIGLNNNKDFELNTFLAKSYQYLENFVIDHQQSVIDFAKTEEQYSDQLIRQNYLQRISHLNSLDDQIIKSLKFPEKRIQKEKKQEKENDEEMDIMELLDLDDFM